MKDTTNLENAIELAKKETFPLSKYYLIWKEFLSKDITFSKYLISKIK